MQKDEDDNYREIYGAVSAAQIPETPAWWERQSRNLYAMCDDSELGMFATMTTITHCDWSPELLAAIRRGPLAEPTEEEMVEYLLAAVPKCSMDKFEEFAYEHVLCHSRRVDAIKKNFMQRNRRTCRGIITDYWDRTEEQQRRALHQRILEWWRRRARRSSHAPIEPVAREVPGHDCQQRAMTCQTATVETYQEDEVYYENHVSRIWGELVRPNVGNGTGNVPWNGWGADELKIAGLAKAIQTRNYIHQCTSNYCLAKGPN